MVGYEEDPYNDPYEGRPYDDDDTPSLPAIDLNLDLRVNVQGYITLETTEGHTDYELIAADDIDEAVTDFRLLLETIQAKAAKGETEYDAEELHRDHCKRIEEYYG